MEGTWAQGNTTWEGSEKRSLDLGGEAEKPRPLQHQEHEKQGEMQLERQAVDRLYLNHPNSKGQIPKDLKQMNDGVEYLILFPEPSSVLKTSWVALYMMRKERWKEK